MKKAKLDEMTKGWFVGNFTPTLYQTNAVEAAIKIYEQGDAEEAHFHKIATEITVIISGCVNMFHQIFEAGEIIIIEPGEKTDFLALEKTVTAVIKIPGANHDKYIE